MFAALPLGIVPRRIFTILKIPLLAGESTNPPAIRLKKTVEYCLEKLKQFLEALALKIALGVATEVITMLEKLDAKVLDPLAAFESSVRIANLLNPTSKKLPLLPQSISKFCTKQSTIHAVHIAAVAGLVSPTFYHDVVELKLTNPTQLDGKQMTKLLPYFMTGIELQKVDIDRIEALLQKVPTSVTGLLDSLKEIKSIAAMYDREVSEVVDLVESSDIFLKAVSKMCTLYYSELTIVR